jgi:hypothetical protein
VDTRRALRAVGEELRAADIVDFDVETALAFGWLCLPQIAPRTQTSLIDPLAVGNLELIVDVLGGATLLKVMPRAPHPRRHPHRPRRRVRGARGHATLLSERLCWYWGMFRIKPIARSPL